MLNLLLIAQAGLVPTGEPRPAGSPVSVCSVDRITVNLVVRRDDDAGQEYRQCYVSFWNRPRYVAVTGAAFPLWENRGWRIWTPDCGPYPVAGGDVHWACVFESEKLIVESTEYVYWVSNYDVEAEWPSCLWRRPIQE